MIERLYRELMKSDLKYHVLDKVHANGFMLKSTSQDPNGISEVMKIKEIADRFLMHMNWDGHDIKIMHTAD